MILDEIKTHLIAHGVGTAATIFTGIMPDTPDTVIAILETPGAGPTRVLASQLTQLENPQIAIWARGVAKNYESARTLAQSAFDAIDSISNQTVGGVRYLDAQPLQQPFPVERDENDRVIIGFNVAVTKVPS